MTLFLFVPVKYHELRTCRIKVFSSIHDHYFTTHVVYVSTCFCVFAATHMHRRTHASTQNHYIRKLLKPNRGLCHLTAIQSAVVICPLMLQVDEVSGGGKLSRYNSLTCCVFSHFVPECAFFTCFFFVFFINMVSYVCRLLYVNSISAIWSHVQQYIGN